MKKISIYIFLLISVLGTISCNKEYLDPSTATDTQALNNSDAILAMINGTQHRYSVGRLSPIYTLTTASGLSTKELTVLNAGNADEDFLRIGAGSVQGNNAIVTNLWNQSNLVKYHADLILTNAERVIQDANIKSGVVAHASILRALALGNLATFWEKAPIAVGSNATFSSREDVLKDAIAQLEKGIAAIKAAAPSAAFTSRIVAGFDYKNTSYALIARYSNMLGDYAKATAAADSVKLTVRSFFPHDDIARNAFFETSTSNRNVCEPISTKTRAMGLPDSLNVNDKRIAFFINPARINDPTSTTNLGRASFYSANTSSVPIYRPGEMILIKAEVLARQDKLPEAVVELNKILTKKAANDSWSIGADLAAYGGAVTKDAILYEIYRQRCVELYMSGMKLEDSRRFGRPGPKDTGSERTRNFYPYPQSERDNNTNTPADPAG